jgi:hypothetical protein
MKLVNAIALSLVFLALVGSCFAGIYLKFQGKLSWAPFGIWMLTSGCLLAMVGYMIRGLNQK